MGCSRAAGISRRRPSLQWAAGPAYSPSRDRFHPRAIDSEPQCAEQPAVAPAGTPAPRLEFPSALKWRRAWCWTWSSAPTGPTMCRRAGPAPELAGPQSPPPAHRHCRRRDSQRSPALPRPPIPWQGVADMLATKGVKKAGAEKALEALVAQGQLVGAAGSAGACRARQPGTAAAAPWPPRGAAKPRPPCHPPCRVPAEAQGVWQAEAVLPQPGGPGGAHARAGGCQAGTGKWRWRGGGACSSSGLLIASTAMQHALAKRPSV